MNGNTHSSWMELIDRFEFDQNQDLSQKLENAASEICQNLPLAKVIQSGSKTFQRDTLFKPVISVLALSHGSFLLLKKSSSSYGQVEKHAVVDLWSEKVAVLELLIDTLGEAAAPQNTPDFIFNLDALLESGRALLNHLSHIALRFLGFNDLAPALERCRDGFAKAEESVGKVRFSKESDLPFK